MGRSGGARGGSHGRGDRQAPRRPRRQGAGPPDRPDRGPRRRVSARAPVRRPAHRPGRRAARPGLRASPTASGWRRTSRPSACRSVQRVREDLGDTTHLRYVYELDCLRGKPLPARGGGTPVRAARGARLVRRDRDRRAHDDARRAARALRLHAPAGSEPQRADVPRRPARDACAHVPGLAERSSLRARSAWPALLVLAALFLLVPLVPIGFVQRWREARRARRRTDLERALAAPAGDRAAGTSAEVRPALERLASELGRVENDDLAVQTRRLAWSEPPPVEDEIGELSGDVDRVISEGRR